MFDAAIIGAGPAGATLARLIGGKYRVLLVDKRHQLEAPEDFSYGKCCGGLLAPDAQRMLSRLGLGLPKKVLEEPQLFVVRAIDLQQGLEGYYQRHYINMNRWEFDRWLLSMVPPGVEQKLGFQFRSFTREGKGFRLHFSKDNRTCSERTKILVGADGAFSRVRARAFPGHPLPKRYFAVQEWVDTDGNPPYFSSFFDPEITDYYCWTIPKQNSMIIGAALEPKGRTAEKFETLKRKLRNYGFAFGETVRREGAHLFRPLGLRQVCTGTNGVALLGEAAGWISPSSAEGLSYAFRSALMLADSLKRGIRGFEKRYYQRAGILRRNILLKNIKSRFIFRPELRKAVMRSGLQGMKIHEP